MAPERGEISGEQRKPSICLGCRFAKWDPSEQGLRRADRSFLNSGRCEFMGSSLPPVVHIDIIFTHEDWCKFTSCPVREDATTHHEEPK